MSKLHISNDLSLPLDFVTQSQAILAKKRVGKSYTASVQAEELLKAGQQICVIDPTGAWWGLKSSADGKHAGFSIAVFGGEHADVPLEETAGETIAQAIVEQRFSAILDLTLFRKGQINRFMTPFLETLYRLNREAMHLFVDEADAIAPQKPFGEEARMLGAMEDVVRRGGIRGIGTTLISQRPAVLNKNVLTQCEILCALRIVHHKDIDAIREWVAVHGDEDLAKEMMKSLPALPIGTAWFWAPGWGDLFQQVKIRRRETFDSGATPKPGETKRTAKVLASIDLQKLGEQIKSTVERAKENDPAQLKRKILELQKQIATQKPAAPTAPVVETKTVELPVLTPEHLKMLNDGIAELTELASFVRGTADEIKSQLERIQKQPQLTTTRPAAARPSPTPIRQAVRPTKPLIATNGDLKGPEKRILRALGELISIGKEAPSREMVAAWSAYSPNGSAFTNPLGSLRTKGLITYPAAGNVALTAEGRAITGECEIPSQDELWRRVDAICKGPERKILRALIDHSQSEAMDRETLAEKSEYSPDGSAFTNPLGALRTKGLVEYPQPGYVKVADWLFLESA